LVWGKSTAVNSTPDSMRFEMKATLRAKQRFGGWATDGDFVRD
jgi:hypothetical protein